MGNGNRKRGAPGVAGYATPSDGNHQAVTSVTARGGSVVFHYSSNL